MANRRLLNGRNVRRKGSDVLKETLPLWRRWKSFGKVRLSATGCINNTWEKNENPARISFSEREAGFVSAASAYVTTKLDVRNDDELPLNGILSVRPIASHWHTICLAGPTDVSFEQSSLFRTMFFFRTKETLYSLTRRVDRIHRNEIICKNSYRIDYLDSVIFVGEFSLGIASFCW